MRNVSLLKVPIGNIKAGVLYTGEVLQKTSSILVPFHFHYYIECHVIVSGSCEITVENKKFHLNSGDICIIPKLFAHNVENISSDLKKCVLTFTVEREKKGNEAEYLFFNSIFNMKKARVVKDKKLCDWFIDNVSVSCMPDEFKSVKLKSVFSFFLVRLCEIINSENELLLEESREKSFDERIFFVEEYISSEYAHKASLTELANIMHISERQINRILKRDLGMGFSELLIKQRMMATVEKLENTDLPLTEIAMSVGFESYSGFFAAFKKTFGVPPEYMRKNFRG